jgi:predicted metal-dependent phosphoesterase TrpH
VITDHNTIQGALEAARLEPNFVIIGEEIQTTYGEFLAFFVKEEIPEHLDPFKVLDLLHAQNAFISISHPFDPYRSGWPIKLLEEIAHHVDAIEVANARVLRRSMNDNALIFANAHGLPGTAGSDGHDPSELGRMALELPVFQDASSLREVIKQAKVVGTISPAWVHLFSTRAKLVKKLQA